ncbi:MAG: diacylglycerol/lipid kinase family protein [Anaerolineales bacterium]
MTAKIILNPYSGRWKALERKAEVEAALNNAGIDVEWALTESSGHAEELATQAVSQGYRPILAAGGDGTLNEVLNGMAKVAGDGPIGPFGILPVGTANDLADNLGLPKNITEAANVIAAGHTRKMDLCQVNGRYFHNNAGLGLEPYITILQAKMERLRGNMRYLVAALQGIAHNLKWNMHIEWDDGQYQGPVSLVSVGNCHRTGGIFYTVPHADPFDGKLSFAYGYLPTRLKTLRALPMTMKSGKGNITEHPAVHEIHCTWLSVHAKTPTPAHVDGEVFDEAAQELEYRVLPGKLEIFM